MRLTAEAREQRFLGALSAVASLCVARDLTDDEAVALLRDALSAEREETA